MEEPLGAQYAIHIAMITLKDRCKNLQQRVTLLEEENLNLRLQCTKHTDKDQSFTEREQLHQQLAELTEQKQQLVDRVRMVTVENKELWNRLSKLNKVNQNLGVQLSRINDSLEQHTTKNDQHQQTTVVVNTKILTPDESHTKIVQKNLEENGRISTELEEISLKIINSLTQGKLELDSLYSDIADIQVNDNLISDSCGFYFDEFDGNIFDEFNTIVGELKTTKQTVIKQGELLKGAFEKIKQLQEEQISCDRKQEKQLLDKSTLVVFDDFQVPVDDCDDAGSNSEQFVEKICPICSKIFAKDTNFETLTVHVEQHFVETPDFEML